MDKQLNVVIPMVLYMAIKIKAAEEGIPVKEWVKRVIKERLDDTNSPKNP